MPELLMPLTSDGNSRLAKSLRARLQPRDKYGRWVPTGASLLAGLKLPNGSSASITGKSIGGTATKEGELNEIRMLVGKGYEKYGVPSGTVLTVNPKNGEITSGATLDRAYLEKLGIDPDLKANLPEDLADQPQTLQDMRPTKATPEDVDLATNGLTPEEDAPLRKQRDAEPVAKIAPALAEQQLSKSEIADVLDGTESQAPQETEDSTSGLYKVDGAKVDSHDIAALDALNKASDGDAPNLDDVISKASEEVVGRSPLSLNPGDIVRSKLGKDFTVVSIKSERGGAIAAVTLQDENGDIGIVSMDSESLVGVVKGKKSKISKPSKPAKAETPTTPDAPEVAPEEPSTPDEPAAPEEPSAPEAPSEPAVDSRANDDGKLIPRQKFANGELDELRKTKLAGLIDQNGAAVVEFDSKGKAYNPKDPNALLNFLAKIYPSGKFNDQGHLVLMRERAKEGGKDIQWEIRAANAGNKKVIYMFHFKDMKTGEESTLIHKDARDSLQSLIGKTNSPEVLADILTGKQTRKFGRYDSANAEDVAGRAHYFTLQDRTKSIKDLVKHYANGVAARYNTKNGTRLEDEVQSLYDAIASGDFVTAKERLVAVFGRIPMDEKSHAEARTAIREDFANRYPDINQRAFGALITNASDIVKKGQFNDPNARSIPYASADNVRAVKIGDVVEFENNLKQKSTLRVAAFQQVNTSSPSQSADSFGYGDYVTVIDANGKKIPLPTTKLRILKDQNTELSTYQGKVTGRELREARGIVFTPGTLKFPNQTSLPDKILKSNEMIAGDSLYSKSGDKLGQIVEIVPIEGKDGKKGYGILYVDKNGDLGKIAIGDGESRGPKFEVSSSKIKPSEAPKPKEIIANSAESDPDFDIDGVQFETDPDTVEKPRTVSLDFALPQNAKRNEEQQLNMNEEIQQELDIMSASLADKMPEGWTYDASSLSAKSFFSASEFDALVEKARAEYPDLSDFEIRTLLELQHAKASGFFSLSKQQIIDRILRNPATYKKADGGIRIVQIDVKKGENNVLDFAPSQESMNNYFKAFEDIDKFAADHDIPGFNPENNSIRVVGDSDQFADLYQSTARFSSTSRSELMNNVLGVNIGSASSMAILINDGLHARGGGANSVFANPVGDTVTHEFGHSVHRWLQNKFNSGDYAPAFKDFISQYGGSSIMEHFAESFSKYIQTGDASPAFLAYLKSVGIIRQ